jgi:hypothetical protein
VEARFVNPFVLGLSFRCQAGFLRSWPRTSAANCGKPEHAPLAGLPRAR